MANLKDLKNRIASVKSTQKITRAMKVVSASKLKRAQERAEAGRPFTEKMERIIGTLATSVANNEGAPTLLAGTGNDHTHLFVIFTTDRGLCGGLNGGLVRAVKKKIFALKDAGKEVKLLIVGRKGWDLLRNPYEGNVIRRIFDVSKKKVIEYADAEDIATTILQALAEEKFDVCHLAYNNFVSAISQVPTLQQIVPLDVSALSIADELEKKAEGPEALYEYEPGEEVVLEQLLPQNLAVQIYSALLETSASEHGARMSAMENATRNAGDMINKLTLVYNRTRQAAITTELTEIISGAEAV